MRKRHRGMPLLAVLLAALFLLAVLLRTRINPLTEELALAQVNDAASNVINEAVNAQLTENDIRYEDLVTLERDSSGSITALTTNIQEMNRLKTQLLQILSEDVWDIGEAEISIPVGNLTGIPFLSGRGPDIPVRIVTVSSADASFDGEFFDAGINQTIHRVMLTVSMDLVVLLPSGTVTDHVSTDICVAETVLIGPVPDSYTYFNSAGSDTDSADARYFASE